VSSPPQAAPALLAPPSEPVPDRKRRRPRFRGPRSLKAQLAVAALAMLLVPLAAPSPYVVRICTLILLYSVLAVALNIVVGLAGLLDLGFIAFFGVGAYTYALLASPLHSLHVSFWLVLPLGAGVAVLLGFFVGLPALRTHGDYLAIVTLGFGEIVAVLLINLDRPVNITNGPQGVLSIDQPHLGSYTIGSKDVYAGAFGIQAQTQFYLLFAVYAVVVIFCCLRLPTSRLGRAWRAMRESEVAASSCGVSIVRAKLSAFMFSAGIAGGAGVVTAAWYGSVFPDSFLFSESIRVLAMVVLGGMGSVWGCVLGAAALVVIPELLRQFEQYRLLVFGLVLVLMMLFRPQGLLGGKAVVRRSRTPNGITSALGGLRRGGGR